MRFCGSVVHSPNAIVGIRLLYGINGELADKGRQDLSTNLPTTGFCLGIEYQEADKKERPSEEGRIYAARLVKSSLKSAVRRFGSEQDKGNQTVIQLSMGNLQTNLVPIGAQFWSFSCFFLHLCA